MHREQYASYQLCENYKNYIYLPERKNPIVLICLNRTHQDPFFFLHVHKQESAGGAQTWANTGS